MPNLKMVRGWSSDRVITRVEEKLALAEKYQAQAIDMENGTILSFLEELGLACTILRVVSDDLSGDLPDLRHLYDPQGRLRAGALTIALAKNPLAGARLIAGAWQGLKSLEELALELSGDV
jgi:nucleoside phosphorylase